MGARRALFLLLSALTLAIAQTGRTPATVSRKALDLLLAAKYAELTSMLTDLGKERLTPAFLRDKVGVEIKGFGTRGNIGLPVTARDGTNTLVSFPVAFSRTTVNIQFTINESMRVAGLYLRPADA